MTMRVQTDAARTDRSLGQAAAPRQLRKDPQLLLWRRLLEHTTADAKRTKYGLPTDVAILARWWVAENRPFERDKAKWETSFDCACHWLDLDPKEERKKRLGDIDEALHAAYQNYVNQIVYQRRAAILACTGQATAIGRQYMLPLVTGDNYDDVAGIDGNDLFALYA
jgi:hypothetical protein